MSTAAELRKLFDAGRRLVEQWLAIAEQFAAIRDAARNKGLDWSQIKGLLKATVQDEADGGTRVEKLIAKAEDASAYAAMLGLANEFSENKITRVAAQQDDTADGTPPPTEYRCTAKFDGGVTKVFTGTLPEPAPTPSPPEYGWSDGGRHVLYAGLVTPEESAALDKIPPHCDRRRARVPA